MTTSIILIKNTTYKINTKINTNISPIINYNDSLAITKRQLIIPPPTLNLIKYLNSVRDQGSDGNSVAFSVALISEYQSNILKSPHRITNSYLSPYYIYNLVNVNSINCNNGLDIPSALDILKKYGIPNESIFPKPSSCSISLDQISQTIHSDANFYRIDNYIQLNSIDQIKSCLTNFGPCIISLNVYNDSPKFWIQNSNEVLLGIHTLNIVGYDINDFILRNSWGTSWGNNGYTNLPFTEFNFILNAYSATCMDGTLEVPLVSKITLKAGLAVAKVNPICVMRNDRINVVSILILTGCAALLLGLIIYYTFFKKIFLYKFTDVFKYYSPYVFTYIIFMLYFVNIIIMLNLNGPDTIFGLNLFTLILFSLPTIVTFSYDLIKSRMR
jgi:hypothetical protein